MKKFTIQDATSFLSFTICLWEDFLHKLNRKIIGDNQAVIVENLNVKGLMQNSKLSKRIIDARGGDLQSLTRLGNTTKRNLIASCFCIY